MKRALMVLFTLLSLAYAQAQGSYFGLRADVMYTPTVATGLGVPLVPLPGLQLGFRVLDKVEVRTSLFPLLIAYFLQLDVLYTQDLSDTLRVYGGAGGDLGGIAFSEGGVVGVHATAGLEYDLGSGIGLFGEVQPLYILQAPDYLLGGEVDSGLGFFAKVDIGINFHF